MSGAVSHPPYSIMAWTMKTLSVHKAIQVLNLGDLVRCAVRFRRSNGSSSKLHSRPSYQNRPDHQNGSFE